MKAQPLASISLDLDNQWSYMKTHGDAGWESHPSYFDAFAPHVCEVLKRLDLTITVFIVGQDAALDKNQGALSMLAGAGHEFGNHSFEHEQWIHLHTKERIRDEIQRTQDAIERVTGRRTRGYRGPGFSWSPALLEVLHEGDYIYDASTFPTYIGPLARLYYLRSTRMNEEQQEQRKNLFGSFGQGRRPLKPYFWRLASGGRLLEIPVTTMPVFKMPFHLSYLLYLSRISVLLSSLYLRIAIRLCRLTGTEPSFLLHPLDLLGPEQAPELAFFPGMDLSAARKVELFTRVLKQLGRQFKLVQMSEHARQVLDRGRIPIRDAGPADQERDDGDTRS